ncbi:type II toxin-antitoxin system RelE/ParE family toxin [Mesorhizobium salmacidum]|uniref:Type II toxin-antitoxin system RelE/ParE family toxin n=1 Tax=Mesorhizobium salmacidum TaxID=3015171 RepID=A0ABU8KU30_9HYPH
MKVRFTSPALADLKNIIDHINVHSPRGAHRVRQRIKLLLERIAGQPFLGKRTDDPAIRRLATVPYPYLIFYEAADEEIIVHAVRHGARDPSSMPGQS